MRDGEWAEHEDMQAGFTCRAARGGGTAKELEQEFVAHTVKFDRMREEIQTWPPMETLFNSPQPPAVPNSGTDVPAEGTVGGCVSAKYGTMQMPESDASIDVVVKDEQSRVGRTIGELDWRSEAVLIEPGTLKRNDLLGWHRELCDEARDLMAAKNKDYASDADPLRNFKMSAQVAGISPEQCALIYLGENVAKFRSFIENGGKSYVAGEKFTDHVRDTINFVILLYAILIDRGYFKEKK